MERLLGKVAIVTGGATGIGEAICKKFAREGAKVMVAGMPEDPVNEVVQEITEEGGQAAGFMGDVADADDAMRCVRLAVEKFGKLDILINNAGVFPDMKELQQYDIEVFDNLLRNNIRSCFMMTRMALPELQKTQGCIVSAGSEAGQLGIAKNTPYGGTKGFIHAFMKGVAVEQSQHGVRANCVCPGAIDTAWTRKEEGPMAKEDEQLMVNATPMGRRGTPEEMANVYLFLASDEASFVTGALFFADGGITVAKGSVGEKAHESMKKQPEGQLNLRHSMAGATEVRWPGSKTRDRV
ncbi:SDR family NAD(P)-dependent oxidoreductase [Cesiribacter sp. SM1]|uniref:SDR family NAD(P)-dependent oxidoreductase n=1 Tax=Cesiribacter sp. SM1 TaxID=2861196 RepID=UPI001CD47164|nr:SDR family oxidoreductase [Cesiribacter sp. SM1]